MSGSYLGIDVGGVAGKAAGIEDQQVLWTARSEPYNRPTVDELIAAVRQACANAPPPQANTSAPQNPLCVSTGSRIQGPCANVVGRSYT